WKRRNAKKALEIINRDYGKSKELRFILQSYRKARFYQTKRFRFARGIAAKRNYKIWLNDQGLYQRIRTLAQKGRIRALRGNLKGPTTLYGIGEAARKMGVPIRVFYPSNAEEYKLFRPYGPQFTKNLRNLPVDDRSLVLRTISIQRGRLPWADGWKGVSRVGFHY